MGSKKLPKLPNLLDRKIYKTGQTRGADNDEVYQNRVGRNSTILIPFSQFDKFRDDKIYKMEFENGYIVLISPDDFFKKDIIVQLKKSNLILAENLLIFYETREQWNTYNPFTKRLKPADSRKRPLGGEFIARIPATTASENGSKISYGFNETKNKGAGIRAYEYASTEMIAKTRLQLESIFWHCKDALDIVVEYGMILNDAKGRKEFIIEKARIENLFDYERLSAARILNKSKVAICPLCLDEISAKGFFTRLEQAEGREVIDLTVTNLNLFHIDELKFGKFNHIIYNLGWGHHHCNVVVKDSGINNTLVWMNDVITKNVKQGYITF
jgi:hypothetical protein